MSNENFVNTVNITKEEFLDVFKTIEKYQKHSDVLMMQLVLWGTAISCLMPLNHWLLLFVNY